MRTSVGRRGAFAVTAALAAVVAVAGCQDDGGAKKTADSAAPSASKAAPVAVSPADAVTAAYKKLSAYRSAKFRMAMTMPGRAGAATTMKTSGTIGWNPTVMDMTMDATSLGVPGAGTVRARMAGDAMYVDLSAEMKDDPETAKTLGGKRWMKLDLGSGASAAGGAAGGDSALLGSSLQSDQSPAQQFATLLQSPQITRVGAETVDGVRAQHYRGRLTVQQMLASGNAEALTAEQRKQAADSMKKAGITAEDFDVWVGADDFPVRVSVAMDTASGPMKVDEHLSDYRAKAADVQAPPAGQTFTLQDLMKQAQESGATS
ncbi:hypothetical protein AB0910_19585 [Streptomyces sp. NPDC047002]|uniref:hypothetical protein n=1 Tax=Streptomyces sp. NPDC047002 TaxID=3155475 RepID=UPI0034548A9B